MPLDADHSASAMASTRLSVRVPLVRSASVSSWEVRRSLASVGRLPKRSSARRVTAGLGHQADDGDERGEGGDHGEEAEEGDPCRGQARVVLLDLAADPGGDVLPTPAGISDGLSASRPRGRASATTVAVPIAPPSHGRRVIVLTRSGDFSPPPHARMGRLYPPSPRFNRVRPSGDRRRLRGGGLRRGADARAVLPTGSRSSRSSPTRDVEQPVDIALYDTFAHGQADHDDLQPVLDDRQVRRVVMYTWNFDDELIRIGRRRGLAGYLAKSLPADRSSTPWSGSTPGSSSPRRRRRSRAAARRPATGRDGRSGSPSGRARCWRSSPRDRASSRWPRPCT